MYICLEEGTYDGVEFERSHKSDEIFVDLFYPSPNILRAYISVKTDINQ